MQLFSTHTHTHKLFPFSFENLSRSSRHTYIGTAKFCNISRMLTSKDPRDSLFQEGSSRFLFGRGPSACPAGVPSVSSVSPCGQTQQIRSQPLLYEILILHPASFLFGGPMQGRSLRAATLGSRFTPCTVPFSLLPITHPSDPRYQRWRPLYAIIITIEMKTFVPALSRSILIFRIPSTLVNINAAFLECD